VSSQALVCHVCYCGRFHTAGSFTDMTDEWQPFQPQCCIGLTASKGTRIATIHTSTRGQCFPQCSHEKIENYKKNFFQQLSSSYCKETFYITPVWYICTGNWQQKERGASLTDELFTRCKTCNSIMIELAPVTRLQLS
jgi:hypothetical protein